MFNRIISIFFLVFIAITSIFLFAVALLIWATTSPFDKRKKILHMYTCFWASIYTWLMPAWSIKVTGREKINKDRTYMVISNHQSQLDILVAFRLFFHFKWVSKAEVFKLPLIGWNMVLNRYIKINRGDRESASRMMIDCEKTLASGSSLYFFPEGTRSKTGIMRDFKLGAFTLAHKMKIPILPIVINGTRKALPKYSLNFHGSYDIAIKVLDEIPYEKFKNLSIQKTAEMAKNVLARHIHEHQAELQTVKA